MNGWPEAKEDANDDTKEYWQHRSELIYANGILFRGDQIIIPHKIRQEMFDLIHYGHMGIETCLRRARETMFWPKMNDFVKSRIRNCTICLEVADKQQKEPLQSTPIPTKPFEQIALDIAEIKSKSGNSKSHYLIMSDYYSDFIEVDKLTSISTKAIIEKCQHNFSRHGLPKKIIADDGTQFHSKEFIRFAKNDCKAKVTLSSPYHHQANGKAESAVKIVKRLFKKADKCAQERWKALLEWRNTTNAMNSSPAQRLFSRRCRTLLPMHEKLLQPKVPTEVPEQIEKKRKNSKINYDRSARELLELEVDKEVYVKLRPDRRDDNTPAIVKQKIDNRKYVVETQNGGRYVRNRRYIYTYEPKVNLPSTSGMYDKSTIVISSAPSRLPTILEENESEEYEREDHTQKTTKKQPAKITNRRPSRKPKQPDWYGNRTSPRK